MNAVLAGVMQNKGKILAAQRNGGPLDDKWEFPGGKVERTGSAEEALVRGILEEFGGAIEVGPRIIDVPFPWMGKPYTLMAIFARYVSGEYQLKCHRQIRWVDLDGLARLNLAPPDIPVALAISQVHRTEGK